MARGKRQRIDTNIYQDAHGYAIVLKRAGKSHEFRGYPLDTPRAFLRKERKRLLDDILAVAQIRRGTLGADITAYLNSLPEGSLKRDRTRELHHWKVWETRSRHAITTPEIQARCHHWSQQGIAASSVKHRLDALRAVYKHHDQSIGPCAGVVRPRERRDVRVIPQALTEAVLMALGTGQNHARIRIIARTGLPHAQIKRLRPADIDLQQRTMFVRARHKGAGVPGRTLPLTHAAVLAFQEFIAHNAFGPFSNSSLHSTFQRAVQRARTRWCEHCGPWPAPPNFRPYDLRHGFLTEVYRQTRDLRVTAEFGLHADMKMTAMYAQAAVSENASAARDRLDGKVPDGTNRK